MLIVGDIPSVGSTTSDGSGSQLQAYETMSIGEDLELFICCLCGLVSSQMFFSIDNVCYSNRFYSLLFASI